jgi:[ribosomal protein S18]-alanine N-acetyltransferase
MNCETHGNFRHQAGKTGFANGPARMAKVGGRVTKNAGAFQRVVDIDTVRFIGEGACMSASVSTNLSQLIREQTRIHIRWMIRRDMPEVLNTETNSFDYSWTEEDFLRCLRQRNCIGMVAEHGDKVVGFMIYELHKKKLHVLNFAVNSEYRRRGIGRQMIAKLVGKLSSHRRTKIDLAVRETNLSAQMFFRDMGFMATRMLKNYYDDSGEDAYLMQFGQNENVEMIDSDELVNRVTQYEES